MKHLIASAALSGAALSASAAEISTAELTVSRSGTRSVATAPAENFTGKVTVEMLFKPNAQERASAGSVSFSPGARTTWHTHPLGQTLIVTAGVGRVQREGGPVMEIRAGDVVRIAPNTRHWHGAAPDSAMTHIALTEALDGRAVDWAEPVTDEQYGAAPLAPAAASAPPPAQGQKLFGDIAPKFAQLTDEVLFADVWARPGLSQRDRSLITVSALIAMNRPDQLRGHLARARSNGLSEAELIEAITHLAFYAGWPSAVTAVGVAREVFNSAPKE